jgi:hypothetical protein
MSIGFGLSLPVSANASDGVTAPKHSGHAYRVAHQHAIPATAEAVSPAARSVVREPETDGLSRNPEDCNMGCVDN